MNFKAFKFSLKIDDCVLVTWVSPAKMAESIEMPFGGRQICMAQGTMCELGVFMGW